MRIKLNNVIIIALMFCYSNTSFCCVNNKDTLHTRGSEYLCSYINAVDHSDGNDYKSVLQSLSIDTNVYYQNDEYFNTLDFFVVKLFMSNSYLNEKRQTFLNQLIKQDYYDSLKSLTSKALVFYFQKNIDELNLMKDELNGGLIESLIMTIKVSDFEFNEEYSIFYSQLDSIQKDYQRFYTAQNSNRLLLPIIELFSVWHGKYPDIDKSAFILYIENHKWIGFDKTILSSYVEELFKNNFNPNTPFNQQAIKFHYANPFLEFDPCFSKFETEYRKK